MITIHNLEEMNKYYDEKTNIYIFSEDLTLMFDVDVDSDIVGNGITARNIKADDITALDIVAYNIDARNIKVWDIDAYDVVADDITARNIKAWDIDARNIKAGDIDAGNIKAGDIDAGDIDAENITARNIKANDIDAWDIKAGHIDAGNIVYASVCMARDSFKCKSVNGSRKNSIHKCLDKEIEYVKEEI